MRWKIAMLCCAFATPAAGQVTLLDDGRWRVSGLDPGAASLVQVQVDRVPAGAFGTLLFEYANDAGFDAVLVLRGDGAIEPALPGGVAGASASLGSYWDCERGLLGPLAFVSLELPAASKKSGKLDLRGQLSNLDSLESEKLKIRIRPPKPDLLRIDFKYRLRATRQFCVDRERHDTQEEFHVVELQASYLAPDAHTNDLVRYVKDLRLDCDLFDCDLDKVTFCAPLENQTGYVIDNPQKLHDRRMALFHTSELPSATPTLELELRSPSAFRTKPQGFVTESSDPAERNVSVWANWVDAERQYGEGKKVTNVKFRLDVEPPRSPGCDRVQD